MPVEIDQTEHLEVLLLLLLWYVRCSALPTAHE
jgi:hypothetical protein